MGCASYSVYKHTTPSGKTYIGITTQKPEERWRKGNGYRTQVFWSAVKKYGWENISHEILHTGLTKAEAEEKEIELIGIYKSNDKRFGYNVENGGNTAGTHSEETKKKISQANKGRIFSEETKKKMQMNHADFKGKNHPLYGKKFTDEMRKKMSEVRKGKHTGEENPMFGRHHSEETRRLQSVKRKGKCAGEDNHKARSIVQIDLNGTQIKTYKCILDATRELGLSRGCDGHISACAKGKAKTAYGYKWEYAENEVRE